MGELTRLIITLHSIIYFNALNALGSLSSVCVNPFERFEKVRICGFVVLVVCVDGAGLEIELTLKEWGAVDRVGSGTSGGEGGLSQVESAPRSSRRYKKAYTYFGSGHVLNGMGSSRLQQVDLGEDDLVVELFELL